MSQHVHCKYHQQTPARWHCGKCYINYCSSCINDLNHDNPPDCAICGHPLQDKGLEALIPPFWNKIPLFFKLVFAKPVLILMVLLILCGYILPAIPVVGGLFTVIILPLIFLKYAYLLLQKVAFGELQAPTLTQIMQEDEYQIIFKQIFVLALLFAPLDALADISPLIMYTYYLFALFLIPATIMVLSMEDNFFRSINPLILLTFIKRIGFSYLGLYLLLIIISGGPGIIFEMLISSFYQNGNTSGDGYLIIAIFAMLQMYFTLVIFAVMGYFLLKYHHRLGYEIEVNMDNFIGGFKKPPAIHPLLKDIEVLIRENKHSKALEVLRGRLMDNLNDIEIRNRYHKLLLVNNETERLINHGDDLINLLLSSKEANKAVTIYQDCINIKEDFSPTNVENYLPLAEIMMRLGLFRWVVKLLNGFHHSFPQHCDTPDLYFLLAKALSDGLKQDKAAIQVLHYILKKYPQAQNKQEVENYLSVIMRVAQLSPT